MSLTDLHLPTLRADDRRCRAQCLPALDVMDFVDLDVAPVDDFVGLSIPPMTNDNWPCWPVTPPEYVTEILTSDSCSTQDKFACVATFRHRFFGCSVNQIVSHDSAPAPRFAPEGSHLSSSEPARMSSAWFCQQVPQILPEGGLPLADSYTRDIIASEVGRGVGAFRPKGTLGGGRSVP